MKKLVAIVVALIASLSMAASAQAANETVEGTTNISAINGPLYQTKAVPVNLTIRAEVTTPAESPKVNPLKNSKITFPAGVSFNPNNSKTPACTDNMLSVTSNLADPSGVVASCKDSVVGTGTSAIFLAKVNLPQTLISDPILVIFNAGTDKGGHAKMKIYAYSKTTNVGILMHGTVSRKGIINVFIPVLANDSATASFILAIPGPGITDGGKRIKGRDPNYARIRCSSGKWVTRGTFVLGERTYPAGNPTGPSTTVKARASTVKCHGARG